MSYTATLIYEIEVPPASLAGITSSVASAAAAGLSSILGGIGSAAGAVGRAVTGGGGAGTGGSTATATGSAGRIAAVLGGPNVGGGNPPMAMAGAANVFATAVRNFRGAVYSLTKAVAGMASGTAAAATGAAAPGPTGGINASGPGGRMSPAAKMARLAARQYRKLYKKTLLDLEKSEKEDEARGQSNLLNMIAPSIGGGLGALLSSMGTQGVGAGSGAGKIGNMLRGPRGAAIGAKISAFVGGVRQLGGSVPQLAKASIGANASHALHGLTNAAQGVAKMFGPWGQAFGAALGVFHKFIDGMDAMVDQLGQYNGKTAQAIGQYKAHQIMMQVRLSRLLEPIMTAWVHLKMKVIDGLLNVAESLLGPVDTVAKKMKQLAGAIGDAIGNIGKKSFQEIMADLAKAAMEPITKAREKQNGISLLTEGMGKAIAAGTGRAAGKAIHFATTGWRRGYGPGWDKHPKHELSGPGTDSPMPKRGADGLYHGPWSYMNSAVSPWSYMKPKHVFDMEDIKEQKGGGATGISAIANAIATALSTAGKGIKLGVGAPEYTPIDKEPDFQLRLSMKNTFEIHNEQMLHQTIEQLRNQIWKATRQSAADGRLALTMMGANSFGGDGL